VIHCNARLNNPFNPWNPSQAFKLGCIEFGFFARINLPCFSNPSQKSLFPFIDHRFLQFLIRSQKSKQVKKGK